MKEIIIYGESKDSHELIELLSSQELIISHIEKMEEFEGSLKKNPSAAVIFASENREKYMTMTERIRRDYSGPVIMIGSEEDLSFQSMLYDLGVSNYISDKESPLLIFHCIVAFINLYNANKEDTKKTYTLASGRMQINEDGQEVVVDGNPVRLTLNEWKVLIHLVRNLGKTVSRQNLLEEGLSYDYGGYDRLLDTYIRNLRNKIGSKSCIETVRGYGYCFTGNMEPAKEALAVG